ncbi:unnamed protein product, partial [Didymodactylos carnosus]
YEADNPVIREEFLGFTPITDLSGRGIAETVIQLIREHGLDVHKLRGQGFDGAGAMSGKFNGVQKHIRDLVPSALYVHCSNHTLNLAIGDACVLKTIRSFFGMLKCVINFINSSPKRTTIFKNAIEATVCITKKRKLISLCDTRW